MRRGIWDSWAVGIIAAPEAIVALTSALFVAGAALVLMAAAGCTIASPTKIDVGQSQNQTVTQAAPSPTTSPSASPAPGSGAAAASLEVHFFGVVCNGVRQAPDGNTKVLKLGCVAQLTASPYDASGKDIGQPADSVAWSASGCVQMQAASGETQYNRDFKGVCVGPFDAVATARGLTNSLNNSGTGSGTVVP